MSEYTKGPWLTRHLTDTDGDYDVNSWDIHAFPYGKEAGQQGICYGSTRLGDANLISAAPEMYEAIAGALRLASLWFAEYVNDEYAGETEALSNMMSNFKKAIAKAEGREE